ncbi:MAG: PEP-CTERM sorting domain-containing protein [Chthonomonas sp.]|nr:PEP-CTERM sorting domain-containing protein [Chthonomonas sp.]
MKRYLGLTILVLGAVGAQAQVSNMTLSTTSPNWVYNHIFSNSIGNPGAIGRTTTSSTNGAGYFNPGTGLNVAKDALKRLWFYYNGDGGGREYALSNQVAATVGASSATMTYREWDGANNANKFEWTLTYNLTATSVNSATMTLDWKVKNVSAEDHSLNVFILGDLGGSNDSITYNNGRYVFNTNLPNSTKITMDSYGLPITSYEATKNDATFNKLLGDSSLLTNLTNVASETGDVAGAYHFNIGTLRSNDFRCGQIVVKYEAVPEPATMAALGLGVLAVAARRRRSN